MMAICKKIRQEVSSKTYYTCNTANIYSTIQSKFTLHMCSASLFFPPSQLGRILLTTLLFCISFFYGGGRYYFLAFLPFQLCVAAPLRAKHAGVEGKRKYFCSQNGGATNYFCLFTEYGGVYSQTSSMQTFV